MRPGFFSRKGGGQKIVGPVFKTALQRHRPAWLGPDRPNLAKQMLRLGHHDFDDNQQQTHKCGEFYEEGFRPAQKMAVETHAFTFLERRHALVNTNA